MSYPSLAKEDGSEARVDSRVTVAVLKDCKSDTRDDSQIWSAALANAVVRSLKEIRQIHVLPKVDDVINDAGIGSEDVTNRICALQKITGAQYILLVGCSSNGPQWAIRTKSYTPKATNGPVAFFALARDWISAQESATVGCLTNLNVKATRQEIIHMEKDWGQSQISSFQYAKAIELADMGRFIEAEDSASAALQTDPSYGDALGLLAAIEQREGKLDQIGELARRAATVGSSSSYAHRVYGLYLSHHNEQKSARTEFLAAARLDPDSPDPFECLGDLDVAEDDLAAAIANYQRALQACPYGSFSNSIQEKIGYWSARAAPKYFSLNPPAPVELDTILKKENSRKGTNYFANPLECTAAMTDWAKALTSGKTNELTKAGAIFKALVTRAQSDDLELRPRTARQVFEDWSLTNASFDCQNYAYLYVALARAVNLKAFAVDVEKTADGEFGYHCCAAVFFDGKAVLVDPSLLWFGAPHLKFTVMDDRQAAAAFFCSSHKLSDCEMAVEWAPRLLIVNVNLFECQLQQGQLLKADESLIKIEALDPGGLSSRFCEAQVALSEADFARGIALLQEASKISPSTGNIYRELGDIYMKINEFGEAREAFNRALACPLLEGQRQHVVQALKSLSPGNGASQ